MKKIVALLMVLVLTCGMLVSCDNAKSLIEKADAALLEAPYSMTMKMAFECDNEEVNEILSMMNMEVPMIVDGNNMSMDMSMDFMGYEITADVIVMDMVMYYDMTMMEQNIKMKCTMTDEQYQQFASESNAEMPVDPEDFAKLTVENKDGKKYIACAEISEEGLKELNDMMEEALEALGGGVKVNDITYGITLNDGKYESMDMTCQYAVTIDGETCNVSFTVGVDFEYGDFAKIAAPEDADSYQEVNFSEIMGQ